MLDKDDSDQLLDRIKQNEFFIALEKFNTLLNQFGKDAPDVPNVPATYDVPDVPDVPATSDVPTALAAPDIPTASATPVVLATSDVPTAPATSDVPATTDIPAPLDPPDIPDIPDILDSPDIPIDLCEDRSFHEVDKENNRPLKRQRQRIDNSIMDLQDVSDNGSSDDNFVEEPKRRKSQKQREKNRQQTASGRKALDVKRKLLKETRKQS